MENDLHFSQLKYKIYNLFLKKYINMYELNFNLTININEIHFRQFLFEVILLLALTVGGCLSIKYYYVIEILKIIGVFRYRFTIPAFPIGTE